MRVEGQKAHTARIVRYAQDDFAGPSDIPSRIRDSWRRSIELHGMDPTRRVVAPVLTRAELRERQSCNEALVRVAEAYVGTLYREFARLNYCILLTDADGATLDLRNCAIDKRELDRMSLAPGACWSEQSVGTGGIGTCIHDRTPILVHRDEHFSTQIIDMSCSAAPVFGEQDEIVAVLNVTGVNRGGDRRDQRLMYNLVVQTATMIENAWFLARNPHAWIAEINTMPGFFADAGDQLIAFDDTGRIVAANRAARRDLLGGGDGGQTPASLDEVFEQNAARLIDNARAQPGGVQSLTSIRVDPAAAYYGRVRAPARQDRAVSRPARPSRRVNEPGQGLDRIASSDPQVANNLQRIERIIDRGLPILLLGETGSGKEWFARAVHEESRRSAAPFVAINCAAIPETLIESELFGYRGGAFTGAKSRGEKGKILQADGGTLFLDEIGDMPASLQTRLLRVLSEGEVLPLGSTDVERVDISVVCATHRDLPALVHDGRFREDLFYRLNAATFRLPPLRERSDLLDIVDRVCAEESELGGSALPSFTERARSFVAAYAWPGNIRQLRNVMRYAMAVCDGPAIDLSHFPSDIIQSPLPVDQAPACRGEQEDAGPPEDADTRRRFERDRMIAALRRHSWHVSAAAKMLGVARATFYRRMKRYNIIPPNRADAARR